MNISSGGKLQAADKPTTNKKSGYGPDASRNIGDRKTEKTPTPTPKKKDD